MLPASRRLQCAGSWWPGAPASAIRSTGYMDIGSECPFARTRTAQPPSQSARSAPLQLCTSAPLHLFTFATNTSAALPPSPRPPARSRPLGLTQNTTTSHTAIHALLCRAPIEPAQVLYVLDWGFVCRGGGGGGVGVGEGVC
jgi:hypothetical protein